MAAVNWDAPSTGLVDAPAPSLLLTNHQGSALVARATKWTALAISNDGPSVVGLAAKGMGVLGANQVAQAAIAGANRIDPAASGTAGKTGGVGVLGATNRIAAAGVVGLAQPESPPATGSGVNWLSVGVYGQGDVGVGVRGVGKLAGVVGTASGGTGVLGTTSGILGPGVHGVAKGGPGVDAYSDAGPGVRGFSAQAHGVMGEAKADNAAGVIGRNDGSNQGIGVDGWSQDGIAVRGTTTTGTAVAAGALSGVAVSASSEGASAVVALSNASQAPAVNAVSNRAVAVSAFAPKTFAVSALGAHGLLALAGDANDGTGVNAYGKYGVQAFGTKRGVVGMADGGIGVEGHGHWAGGVYGNVFVKGLLLKYASLFSIDHPLDPERKVLNHAGVEAPEYKTYYDGEVTLNRRGRASVRMPRWFEALNGKLRYQLTPVGAPAPDLHVARELEGATFVIAGGHPGQKVCWQVTGVRRDAWARAHPLEVEQSKRTGPPALDVRSEAAAWRKARELKRRAAARWKAAETRKRPTRARRPSAPRKGSPQGPPPGPDTMVRDVAMQTMAVLRQLMERYPMPG